MKEHFDKIIVERPRHNSRGPNNKAALPRDMETAVKQESMKGAGASAARSWWKKELNENLNPLYRFLDKQVGRPWDKVYSEVRARITPGNTVQEHILGHLEDRIVLAKHVKMENGAACYRSTWRSGKPIVNQLYVDPVDGIVKKKIVRKEKVVKRKKATWRVGDKIGVEHNGFWYEVVLGDIAQDTSTKEYYSPVVDGIRKVQKYVVSPTDALLGLSCEGRAAADQLYAKYLVSGVYAKTKKQMSTREKKRYGVI